METRQQKTIHSNITPVMSKDTYDLIESYLNLLKKNDMIVLLREGMLGRRLYEVIKNSDIKNISTPEFIDALFKTTKPIVFAENIFEVKGDGSDWTKEEISLLGRITKVVSDATVYAKKTLNIKPEDFLKENERPQINLLCTNGALLAGCAADLSRITDENGKFSKEKFDKFLIDQVLPALQFARGGVATLPILGGGYFAGDFSDEISAYFPEALKKLIEEHQASLPDLKGIVLTLRDCEESEISIGNIPFITTKEPIGLYPQAIRPEFAQYKTYTLVAGDHVSFPGNDLYSNKPNTHEGGCFGGTNGISIITNHPGHYSEKQKTYLPQMDKEYKKWEDICAQKKTTLNFDKIVIIDEKGNRNEIHYQASEHYNPNYLDPKQDANYVINNQLYPFENIRNVGALQVRRTIGNMISSTLALNNDSIYVDINSNEIKLMCKTPDELRILKARVEKNNIKYTGENSITFGIEEGLQFIHPFVSPYEGEFKQERDLHGQDILEHLLLIGLEKYLKDNTQGLDWAYPRKPYFNMQGELVYPQKNKPSFIVDLSQYPSYPLFEKLKEIQIEKSFYHALIMMLKEHIYNNTWTVTGFMGEYKICLAQGGKPSQLSKAVEQQWNEITSYLQSKDQKDPRIVFQQIQKLGSDQSKIISKNIFGQETRDPETKKYYKIFNKTDKDIFNEFNSKQSLKLKQ